jgi:hypothetical protein
MNKKCLWKKIKGGGVNTSCERYFFLDLIDIKENGFIFCQYCGKKIKYEFHDYDNSDECSEYKMIDKNK